MKDLEAFAAEMNRQILESGVDAGSKLISLTIAHLLVSQAQQNMILERIAIVLEKWEENHP